MVKATATDSTSHAHHLFPAPLHIRKKSRRLSRLRLSQRKPTRGQPYPPYGPLDDIIDEITGDIWHSLPFGVSDWATAFTDQFPWLVTPLPLSRVPSQQPLAVRKTRASNSNTRSTTSSATFSDIMASSWSRDSTQGGGRQTSGSSDFASEPPDALTTALPRVPFALPTRARSASPRNVLASTGNVNESLAEQQLSTILENSEPLSKFTSAPLRRRFFSLSNGMDKLRLKTGEWVRREPSSAPISPAESLQHSTCPSPAEPCHGQSVQDVGLCPEDVVTWMEKNGRRQSVMTRVCSHASQKYPSPLEYRQELPSIVDPASEPGACASTLAAAIRIIPEVKVLAPQDEQTFWVAVEVEGVLHNKRPVSEKGIDVIFLVDNSYYVTSDCLNRALDLVMSSSHELKKHDRVAFYTTHCTHESVTGTVPDMWYPLGPADNLGIESIRELVGEIRTLGTQTWKWPRPNPAMDEVIISIARSLEAKELRCPRTQAILLSPVAHQLHKLSEAYPALQVHQINPSVLPLRKVEDVHSAACLESCCCNVTINNLVHYQSPKERIRQVMRYARSEKPLGSICNVHIDLRRRPGCEVLGYEGTVDIPSLRLGQVHTFFAELKVQRSQTEEMDLDSHDPIRDSSLAADNLRQDLRNARVLGASKAHLLSVQVMHQSSMMPSTHWTFTEIPLTVVKELGRLSAPTDRALDVYKRRLFHIMSRSHADEAVEEVDQLEKTVKPHLRESVRKTMDHMMKEREAHKDIVHHEQTCRKNLPSCPGPVPTPYAHDFVIEKWEARARMRAGNGAK